MQTFQDITTGQLWAFDDGVNPHDYPSTPKTLSTTIIEKPSEAHVWQNGNWVLDSQKQIEVANQQVLAQIASLEATITQRRVREAVLGTDNGWLANVEAQIGALRQQLQ